MSVTIIINPISGGASPEQARARAQLASAVVDKHGDPADVFVTEGRGHARELARASIRRGARLVISWGGDGTLNEVASALAFQEDVPLGLVPAGSGNGFARERHRIVVAEIVRGQFGDNAIGFAVMRRDRNHFRDFGIKLRRLIFKKRQTGHQRVCFEAG